MTHIIEDLGRRDLNLHKSKVKDVLPEFFASDYPLLVKFLEAYYEFLEEGDQGFETEIFNLFASRDINQTSLDNLDQLVREIGNGLQVATFFEDPRLMTKLLAGFYRVKGSVVSTEGFFRAFFNQEVTVEYPKESIFIVADSKIGYESLKFIQDNKRYQIFSILVKAGISVSDYEFLYKKFVHPAGFYFEGETTIINDVNAEGIALTGVDSDEIRGVSSVAPILSSNASFATQYEYMQMTSIIDSAGQNYRIVPDKYLSTYSTYSLEELDRFYSSTLRLINPNSFTTDDSAAVGDAGPTTTLTLESMDGEIFTSYLSDSAY